MQTIITICDHCHEQTNDPAWDARIVNAKLPHPYAAVYCHHCLQVNRATGHLIGLERPYVFCRQCPATVAREDGPYCAQHTPAPHDHATCDAAQDAGRIVYPVPVGQCSHPSAVREGPRLRCPDCGAWLLGPMGSEDDPEPELRRAVRAAGLRLISTPSERHGYRWRIMGPRCKMYARNLTEAWSLLGSHMHFEAQRIR